MKLLAIAYTSGMILWGTSFSGLSIQPDENGNPTRSPVQEKFAATANQKNNAPQTGNITTGKKGNFFGMMGVAVSI